MAIAGSAKPAVQMTLTNGALDTKHIGMAQGVENDADEIVRRLVAGESVLVQNREDVKRRVMNGVLALLREAGEG